MLRSWGNAGTRVVWWKLRGFGRLPLMFPHFRAQFVDGDEVITSGGG